jgi:uncharacterized protein
MDPGRLLLLAAAAALGSMVNAVAGGGSLISFPAALAAGLSPVSASATNTVAMAPGVLASALAYRRELGPNRRLAVLLVGPAIVGALAGAVLLVSAPARAFELVVPWLVLAATLLVVARDVLERKTTRLLAPPSRTRTLAAAFAVALLAVYGGYFGAGIGIMLLALLALLGRMSIHQMNAVKTLIVGSINAAAALYFVLTGAADLQAAAAMAAGAILGGYGAASIARRVEPKLVSWLVGAIGVSLSVLLAVRYYR